MVDLRNLITEAVYSSRSIDCADSILAALDAAGLVVVPREPTMTDRNELRRLAEAYRYNDTPNALNSRLAFVSAASPNVVLGLLDEIGALEQAAIATEEVAHKWAEERDELRAALEAIATHNPAVTHGWAVNVREMARNALRGEASGTDYRAVAVRLKEALEIVAAQTSGIPGSTARADCMASIASIALADPEVEKL